MHTPIHHYEILPSTNAEAKKMILNGAREGILLAEHQTAGRGRLGRSFFSENGIFMSVIIAPEKIPFDTGFLTSAVAAAVCRAITEKGFDVGIKWVNDIYLDGKKICGILAEAVSMGAETLAYVVGIGINVGESDFPEEIRDIAATLLLNEKEKEKLFFSVLENIEKVLAENKKTILSYLKEKSIVLGKDIRFFGVKDGEGRAIDLDENGGLVVLTDANEKIILTGGEISVRVR
ncbi:MAG: biotin--[Clostridia bacterium]|nr:biotin--[acetyl-CoA-carboxylase] ligase [Clostridia bacterium]